MASVNIPWQDPAPGAKPCPKCGKTDPHYRHQATYSLTGYQWKTGLHGRCAR